MCLSSCEEDCDGCMHEGNGYWINQQHPDDQCSVCEYDGWKRRDVCCFDGREYNNGNSALSGEDEPMDSLLVLAIIAGVLGILFMAIGVVVVGVFGAGVAFAIISLGLLVLWIIKKKG